MRAIDLLTFIILSDYFHSQFSFCKNVWDIPSFVQLNEIEILHIKLANCAFQCKCKYVFSFWEIFAKESKKIIMYYGVSWHGKRLVDVLLGFRVKVFLPKAITSDFLHCIKKVGDLLYKINVNNEHEFLQSLDEF